jgi:hypothetical protein
VHQRVDYLIGQLRRSFQLKHEFQFHGVSVHSPRDCIGSHGSPCHLTLRPRNSLPLFRHWSPLVWFAPVGAPMKKPDRPPYAPLSHWHRQPVRSRATRRKGIHDNRRIPIHVDLPFGSLISVSATSFLVRVFAKQ